jgi:hypothetical protein
LTAAGKVESVLEMDSVFEGTVIDSLTKQPLANVTVTASSSALTRDQVAVTDAMGVYQVPGLPPGTYELSFTADGFRPFSRGGIPLHLHQTVRVDAELLPAPIG